VKRREFITLLGGAAAAWPLTARAQQPTMPVIGFLNPTSSGSFAHLLAAFRQGLGEGGYVAGQNVAIEYNWGEGQPDRLAALAADLVRRQVAVIVATGGAVVAARAATATIPIVFTIGVDPVREGLIASLNRPGGNVTGVSFFTVTLGPKRLELLREVVPTASVIGLLVNPNLPYFEVGVREVDGASRAMGMQVHVLKATSEQDFSAAFAALSQRGIGALVIGGDPLFNSRRDQLVALAARHAIPAIYEWREFAEGGGLMSYGTNIIDAYRLVGVYAARILKGDKPADLPVQQSTKVELVINLKTAKTLGITFPLLLLGRADEVIE
jgi:putative ABC transport system substrate-binding protein